MVLAHPLTLLVRLLLMFFVVAVISIEKIPKLPNLVLHVSSLDLSVIKMGILELFTEVREVMMLLVSTAIMLFRGRHGGLDVESKDWTTSARVCGWGTMNARLSEEHVGFCRRIRCRVGNLLSWSTTLWVLYSVIRQ